MVIDTSAVVSFLLREDTAPRLEAAIRSTGRRLMSAASLLEAGIIAERPPRGAAGARILDSVLETLAIEIVSVTEQQAELARIAHRRFGRGKHPAALNFGDCFSYSLAKSLNEPLLFVGNDFARTDVVAAPY